jgi:hypothetical protein
VSFVNEAPVMKAYSCQIYYSQDPITIRLITGKSRYPDRSEFGYQISAAIFVPRMTDNRTGYQIIRTKWQPLCFYDLIQLF